MGDTPEFDERAIDELLDAVEFQAHEVTQAEGWDFFDSAAKRYLHMSGEEFLRKWSEGKFDESERPEVARVVMLLPFAGCEITR